MSYLIPATVIREVDYRVENSSHQLVMATWTRVRPSNTFKLIQRVHRSINSSSSVSLDVHRLLLAAMHRQVSNDLPSTNTRVPSLDDDMTRKQRIRCIPGPPVSSPRPSHPTLFGHPN
jgi:hypothetical protein